MATNTTNYNFTKPASDDFYDINVFNENADLIDATLKSISDKADTKTNKAKSGNATFTPSKWTELSTPVGEYNYSCNFALSGITAKDIFNATVSLTTEEVAQDCGLAQYTITDVNKVTFYAKEKPLSDITIHYNYIQGV